MRRAAPSGWAWAAHPLPSSWVVCDAPGGPGGGGAQPARPARVHPSPYPNPAPWRQFTATLRLAQADLVEVVHNLRDPPKFTLSLTLPRPRGVSSLKPAPGPGGPGGGGALPARPAQVHHAWRQAAQGRAAGRAARHRQDHAGCARAAGGPGCLGGAASGLGCARPALLLCGRSGRQPHHDRSDTPTASSRAEPSLETRV